MHEGQFQLFVLTLTISAGLFVMHVLLSPHFLSNGYFFHNYLPDHITSRIALHNNTNTNNNGSSSLSSSSSGITFKNQTSIAVTPVPPLFDHPEPNFQSQTFWWIGEFWSSYTVIPVAGVMLLLTGLRHNYPIILLLLYSHITVMYTGAFFSHMTLIPDAFRYTVTGVVWNSLLAFWLLGDLIPLVLKQQSAKDEVNVLGLRFTLLVQYPWLRRTLALLGAFVSGMTIQYLPEYLGTNGGFVSLSIVQPPFVFLGLTSTIFMKYFTPNPVLRQRYASCPAVSMVFQGGILLMLAMLFSAVECWIDPIFIPFTIGNNKYNFPLMHTIIHIVEQIGIYMYGVGSAGLHFYHVEGRSVENSCGDVQLFSAGFHHKKMNKNSTWFAILPFVATNQNQTQNEALEIGNKMVFGEVKKQQQGSSIISIDLLNRALRCDPHSFYLGPKTNWIEQTQDKILPAEFETKIKCVFDPQLIEQILKNDKHFSSNPFGDDESRYIGLSTTSIQLHAQHISLIAPFFNDQKLRDLAPVFSEIAQFMAKKTFGDGDDYDNNKSSRNMVKKNNNLVWYAYRVVIANALAVFGIDKSSFLTDDGVNNIIDYIVGCSLDMVAAVAPVGGSGTRRRLTIPMLWRITKSLVKATPATLRLILKLGWSDSWKLFRPDTSVLLPLIGFQEAGGNNIRSSILCHPEAFETAPGYFSFMLDELWKKNCKPNDNTIFSCLERGVEKNQIRVAEGLAIIAQLLIGMTAANATVSALKRLMQTKEHPLLRFGRVFSSSSSTTTPRLEACIAPQTDDEIENIFDSESSLSMFINEVLRVDAPLQRMPRRVATDNVTLEVGGGGSSSNSNNTKKQIIHLDKDDQLLLFIGCANLTPQVGGHKIRPFTNDADRAAAVAKSLTFGRGLHRCVGSRLTTMDIESGMEGFLKFFAEKMLNNHNTNKNGGVKNNMSNNLGEIVNQLRKEYTFDMEDMIYDLDVGNFGHRVIRVVKA